MATAASVEAIFAAENAQIPETDFSPVIAELTDARKRYGAITALDGVTLRLRAGEVVALLGPNGAGKSTAVRTLLGLIGPTEGSARVFGVDPRNAAGRV